MTCDPVDLMTPRILVVDGEPALHAALRLRLSRHCELAFSRAAPEGLATLARERFDLCLVDLDTPQRDGLAFIDAARQADPALGYVVIGACGTDENLRRVIPRQAYDFVAKPLPEGSVWEAHIPQWIGETRRRRREQRLASHAGSIARELHSARLEREVEFVASESARDALQQTSNLLTAIHAHLLAASTFPIPRGKAQGDAAPLLRHLEAARKTADAAAAVAGRFFDSAYGNRDSAPAAIDEGVRAAMSIAARMARAQAANKVFDFAPLELPLPIRNLSGLDFLGMLTPAIAAALLLTAPNTTVGIHGEICPRIGAVAKDSRWRSHLWLNRRNALGSHPGVLLKITASAPPLARADLEAWFENDFPPLAIVAPRGLIASVEKCQGLLGFSRAPQTSRFQTILALPT